MEGFRRTPEDTYKKVADRVAGLVGWRSCEESPDEIREGFRLLLMGIGDLATLEPSLMDFVIRGGDWGRIGSRELWEGLLLKRIFGELEEPEPLNLNLTMRIDGLGEDGELSVKLVEWLDFDPAAWLDTLKSELISRSRSRAWREALMAWVTSPVDVAFPDRDFFARLADETENEFADLPREQLRLALRDLLKQTPED